MARAQVVYTHPVRCRFQPTGSTLQSGILNDVNTDTLTTPCSAPNDLDDLDDPGFSITAVIPRHDCWSKPGPVGSWEDVVHRQLRLRRMVELLLQGHSYRSVAKELGLARTTVMRMKGEAASCGASHPR